MGLKSPWHNLWLIDFWANGHGTEEKRYGTICEVEDRFKVASLLCLDLFMMMEACCFETDMKARNIRLIKGN